MKHATLPRKLALLIALLPLAALLGAAYGAVHNQISYTVSPEYFTKFKFISFHMPWAYEAQRVGASVVGALASWWMGVLIYLPLAAISLRARDTRRMVRSLCTALVLVIIIVFIIGLFGLAIGFLNVGTHNIDTYRHWLMPNVENPVAFIHAGWMHNFSYAGGFIGLAVGCVFLWRKVRQTRHNWRA